jgi:ATP-dependent RNA helicase DeaD
VPPKGARATSSATAGSTAKIAGGRGARGPADRDGLMPDAGTGSAGAGGAAASGSAEEAHARSDEAPVVRRTGKETGMTTIYFNVGRKQLVTQAEIVGKIAGVTRLPASVIGAIDLHQRHTLVDVAAEHADLIVQKLNGVRVRGHSLQVALATAADAKRE